MNVWVYRAPYGTTDSDPLNQPNILLENHSIPVSDGEAVLSISGLEAYDVVLITFAERDLTLPAPDGSWTGSNGQFNAMGSGTVTLTGNNTASSVLRAAGGGVIQFTQAASINGFSEIRIGFTNQEGTLRYIGESDAVITKQVRVGENSGGPDRAIESSGSGSLTFSNANFNPATAASSALHLTLGGNNTGENRIQGCHFFG